MSREKGRYGTGYSVEEAAEVVRTQKHLMNPYHWELMKFLVESVESPKKQESLPKVGTVCEIRFDGDGDSGRAYSGLATYTGKTENIDGLCGEFELPNGDKCLFPLTDVSPHTR